MHLLAALTLIVNASQHLILWHLDVLSGMSSPVRVKIAVAQAARVVKRAQRSAAQWR